MSVLGGVISSLGALVIGWGFFWRALDNQAAKPGYLLISGMAAVAVGQWMSF